MIKINVKKQMQTPHGQKLLDIDLNISVGKFVAVFGESGAGKTTLLRMLCGLTKPQEGYIEFNKEVWFDSRKGIDVPVQQRRVGFVFQENTLFPHMTVRENLEFASSKGQGHECIEEWIDTMGLKGLEGQKPHRLSSGQKQRAALIRAIVSRPKILLLDEPLSNLDIHARIKLQDEIIKVFRKTGITMILVSHDIPEVFKLSQKVFVVDHGRIIKHGSPGEIFIDGKL